MRRTNKVDFDDYEIETLEFNFTSSDEVSQFMRGTQTPAIQYEDISTTTKQEGRSIKMQVTEEVISSAFKPKQDEEDGQKQIDYNQRDLDKFMKKVYPMIDNALSTTIKAFEFYEPKWTDSRKEVTCLYTLSNSLNKLVESEGQLEITALSWNCSGLILAAAYGRFEHNGTSNEKSFVCAWNLSKRNFQQDRPSIVIETEVSLTSIEFHPSKPSLLAGGSFNGEIFLWDLQNEEENLIGKSNIDEYFHREAVTQLQWMETKRPGSNQTQQYLLSMSTDGKLLQWNMNYEEKEQSQEQLLKHPCKGYYLLRKREGDIVSVGGLCFAQSNEDKNTFIIGSEAGSVLRALLANQIVDPKNKSILEQQTSTGKIVWKNTSYPFMMSVFNKNLMDVKMHVEQYCLSKGIKEIEPDHIFASKPEIRKLYLNPVQLAYEPHLGPVYSINFSPFLKNIFLTCSLDGSVKLFDLTQAKSLFSVDNFGNYIFKSQWSPKRPSVFGSCMSNGEVAFYDLIENKKSPVCVIEPKGLEPGAQALQFKFNSKQGDLVAVAYSKCSIRIYQLSDNLIVPRKDELNVFSTVLEELRNL